MREICEAFERYLPGNTVPFKGFGFFSKLRKAAKRAAFARFELWNQDSRAAKTPASEIWGRRKRR